MWVGPPALKGEKPALHQHSMSMKAVDTATLDYSLENDIWCGFSPTHHAADRSRSFFRLSSVCVCVCVSEDGGVPGTRRSP